MQWKGVMTAATTPFDSSLHVDHDALERHCTWLAEQGCAGIVLLGSLGEAPALGLQEKLAIVETAIRSVGDRLPVVVGISSLATSDAVELARRVERLGSEALMVLPPYVYRGDWRETRQHINAVLRATELPCLLYNNPVAYGTDLLPPQIAELASENANLRALKESSTDVRRMRTLRTLIGDRLAVLVGVDDEILDGVGAGATGWVAGLANALPTESVELFRRAQQGEEEKALELYRWFLPLLKLDADPKFVQLIKLVQQEVGRGNALVRPPRLELVGEELENVRTKIRTTLAARPSVQTSRIGTQRGES